MNLNTKNQALLDEIVAANKSKPVAWKAGVTSMLLLEPADRRHRCGYVPGPGEPSLMAREKAGAEAHAMRLAAGGVLTTPPPAVWDWRQVNGRGFISAIKDQGACGSCVAFGTAATMDGTTRTTTNIAVNDPNANALQDVSEAQFFYCGAEGQQGRTCATGWWPDGALTYATTPGVAPESFFPYVAGDQPCNLGPGWQAQVTQVNGTSYPATAEAMKQWLSTNGPLIACFTVYADFYAYQSGVYHYNGSAPVEGGHCICVIGYDDNLQAWLCKNSWGTGWGMSGYFYIGYGQCGIDSMMWGITAFSRIQVFAPPGLGTAIGAIAVGGNRPYDFIVGNDGNLWVNWWSGSAWNWANQGTPATGVGIASSMGAIVVDGGRPYAFVKGSDGNLWINWWSGSAWNWANQGTPATGVGIASSMGAIVVSGGRPYVFVTGTDGNLWINWWSGSAWVWSNQGTPATGVGIASSMGAITVDGGRPYVFVTGTDGNLWINWWSGSAWVWSNQGTPATGVGITSSMGAITMDGGRPYVFVTGSDGNLWINWWSGSAWVWSNQGTPATGVSIASSIGAITVDGGRPYVFVKGSDGNLWINWWSGSAWNWANQGTPSSNAGIAGSAGAIVVNNGLPYVFVTGTDGNLWINWWGGSAWGWSNQGGAAV